MPSPLRKLEELTTLAQHKQVSGRIAISTAGTPQRITTTTLPINGIMVTADTDIAIICMVGDSSVDGIANQKQGIILFPTGWPIMYPANDLKDVFFDAESDGGAICFVYFPRAS